MVDTKQSSRFRRRRSTGEPHAPFSRLRAISRTVLILLLGLSLGGCAMFRSTPTYEETFQLTLSGQRDAYRPGEAVVVTAALRNLSGKDLMVQALNTRSLAFYWSDRNAPERLEKEPVVSANERLDQPRSLPSTGTLSRHFVLTDVTPTTGSFMLQAIYRTPLAQEDVTAMAVSRPLEFQVKGARVLERGEDGLITEKQAIALARRRFAKSRPNRTASEENATLIRNEAGLLDWYVVLTLDSPEEEEARRWACLVNPYLGVVRKEASPDLLSRAAGKSR